MKKLLLHLTFVICLFSTHVTKGQITITETITSVDEPAPTTLVGTRVLYGCAWDYTFHVTITASGSCTSTTITYTLPQDLYLDPQPVTTPGLTYGGESNNVFTYTLNGTSGAFDIKLTNACDLQQASLGIPYTSSVTTTPSSCLTGFTPINFQILTPEVLFDNLSYSAGTTIAGPVQLLYKRNDNTTFDRDFKIKIQEGQLRHAELVYDPEYEIMPVTITFTNPVGGYNYTVNYTGQTSFVFDPTEIGLLFNNSMNNFRNYLTKNDEIQVTETFYIEDCTGSLTEDTYYNFKTFCTDNGSPYLCKDNIQLYAVKVTNSQTGISMGLNVNPDLDVCGTTPSDISFTFNNPTFLPGNTMNTSIKKVEQLIFSFDLDAFDFDVNDASDLNNAWITYNGTDVTLTTMNLLAGGQFLTYNTISKKCTLNVNLLTNPLIADAWGAPGSGISPFTNWYSPTEYNDMKEGVSFSLTFNNMSFNYDHAYIRGTSLLLSDCDHDFNYFLFGLNNYNTNIQLNYYRMCEVEPQTITNGNMGGDFLNYHNRFGLTGFAESSSPDLISGGAPVEMDFYFSTVANNDPNPWGYYFAGANPASFFACPNLTYQAEIILPDNMILAPYLTAPYNFVKFYTDPNDPLTEVELPFPTPVLPGDGTRRYVFDLVDDLGVPLIDLNGKILANIGLIPCTSTLSAIADIEFRMRSFCNSACLQRYNTVACYKTQLHWRCNGPCCGPPQGTSNFSFNRTTPGYVDETMTANVVLDPTIQKVNRAYGCDLIAVESEGATFQVGSQCTDETGTYTVVPVSDFYFQIKYTSPTNFQFFEFVSGEFNTTVTGIIPITGFTETVIPGNIYTLKFFVPGGYTTLLQNSGTLPITFNAVLKVKDMLINPPPSFYLIPQIRGQFVSTYNGSPQLSCDDHGDNMTVINVLTSSDDAIAIHEDGWASDDTGWPLSTNGICKRRFDFGTVVTGGIPGIDEFPNEFRPILLWPSPIQMTVPDKFKYMIPTDFGNSIFFRATDRTTWLPVNYTTSGQTITFTGFNYMGDPNHPWPVFEHDGTRLIFAIKGELQNDCPPESGYSDAAHLNFPYIKRAYAPAVACQDPTTIDTNIAIPASDYSLVMGSGGNTTYYVNSQIGTISGITLKYTDNTNVLGQPSYYLEHAWIRNLSSADILITSIHINNPNTTASLLSGYYQLGTLSHNVEYSLTITYELLNCNTDADIPLNLQYGFSCVAYPVVAPPPTTPVDFACKTDEFSVNIHPRPAALSISGQLITSPILSPCSPIVYQVSFDGLLAGDVQNIVLTVSNIPTGYIYTGGNFVLNLYPTVALPAPTAGINSLTWNVTQDLLSGAGFTIDNGLLVNIEFTGDCSLWGTQQTLTFDVTATDICGDALTQVNGSPSTSQVTFPPFNVLNNNCGNCFSCEGLSLNYIEKEKCNFSFNAIVPTNPICANSEVIWDFGDGGTDNGTSVSHQYLSNGSFMVCYTWRCLDSENQLIDSCVVCEKIIVDCASLDTFCLKIPKDFDRDIGEGIVVTPDGGFAVGGTLHEAGAGGDRDMFVVKYSPNITQDFFSTRGDKTGTVYKERGYSILARTDGYFVAGSVEMGSQEDVFVAKFKLDGTLDNGMRYGSSALRSEGAYRIIDMSSSGVEALLVVGYAEVANGDTNMLALKIDPTDLGLIAQNTYYYNSPTTISQEKAYDAVKTGWHTITDHYAIVGEQYETKTDKNVMVTLINTNLGLLQGKIYGSSKRNDIGYGIAAYDTSLFVTGSTSYDGNPDDLLILRMNIINLNYQQNAVFTHSSSTHEIGKKIIIDSDKNLVIAGTNWEGILTSGPDALALKVKPSNLSTAVWSRSTTLQPFSERFHSIAEYGSDYYVATGSYADAGAIADEDIFIVKMTKDSGFSCCLNPYTMVAKSTTYTTRPTDEKKISLKTSPHGLPDIFSGDDFICSAIVPWHMRLAGMEASTRIGTDITLFPNPNSGGFIIRLNNGAISENPYTVNIIDISGRVVAKYMKQANDNSQISIDASDVVSGIYFVEVINTELRWKSKVVIEK